MYCLEKLQRELAYFFDMDLRELPRVQDLLAAKGYTQVQKGDEIIKLEPTAQAESTPQTSEIIFTDKKGKEHTLTKEVQEQWLNTFNLKSLDEAYTPKHSDEILQALGGKEIKLQLGSLKKLVAQGREQYIPQIKEVLDSPEAILKDSDNAFLFAKHLKDDDYFVNVSVDKGEYLVSISNGIKEANNIKNKLGSGVEVVYQSPNANSNLQTLLQASRYSANKIDSNIIPKTAATLSKQAQEYAHQILQGLRKTAQTPLNKLADEVRSIDRRFMLREARYIKQSAQEFADSFANLRWQDLSWAIRCAKMPYNEAMFKELKAAIESKEFAKFIESSYPPKPTQKSLFDPPSTPTPTAPKQLETSAQADSSLESTTQINQTIKDIIDSSPEKGRDMQIIGEANFTPQVVEYAHKNSKKVAIDKLEQTEAEKLGFKHPQDVRVTIDYQAINHTLNRHGADSALVQQSGQKAVDYTDIAKYRSIVKGADESLDSVDNLGQAVIVSFKQINGHAAVVESIRKKGNELAFKSMYFENGSYKNSNAYKNAVESPKGNPSPAPYGYEPHADASTPPKVDTDIIPQSTQEKPKWSRADSKKWKQAKLEQTKAAAIKLYEQLQPIYNQARPLLIKAKELKSPAKAKELKDKAWKLIEQESKPFIKELEQHELEIDHNAFILYPETASIKIQPKSNFDLEWKNKKRAATGLKGAAKYRAQALQRLSEKDYMTPFEQATKASNPLTQLHALKFEILKDLHKAKVYINQQDYDKDLHKTYLGYVNRASSELDSIEQSIRELKSKIHPKPQRAQEVRSKVQDFIKWRDEVRFDTDYLLALESDGVAHALEYLEAKLQAATLPQQASFITQLKEQIKEHFPTPPTPPSPTPPKPAQKKSLFDEVESSGIIFTDKKGKEHTLTKEVQEQWLETFNLKSLDEAYTPNLPQDLQEAIGKEIKLTKGSLYKIVEKGREQYIPQIKETLEKPQIVLQDKSEFIFAKQIKDDLYLTSIGKDFDTHITIISNSPKTDKTIQNKLKNGKVIYEAKNAEALPTSGAFTETNQVPISKGIIPQTQMPKDNSDPVKTFEYFRDDFIKEYPKALEFYSGQIPLASELSYGVEKSVLNEIETIKEAMNNTAKDKFKELLKNIGLKQNEIAQVLDTTIRSDIDYTLDRVKDYLDYVATHLNNFPPEHKPIAQEILAHSQNILNIFESKTPQIEQLQKKRELITSFHNNAKTSNTKEQDLLKGLIDKLYKPQSKQTPQALESTPPKPTPPEPSSRADEVGAAIHTDTPKLESSAQPPKTTPYTDTQGHTHQIPEPIAQKWLETFGLKDLQEPYTPKFSDEVAQALEPILQGESIKLYAGSLIKLIKENRLQYLDRIQPTLEQPQRVILQNDGALIFARDFGDEKYFTSVARNDDGEWIIRSNAPKSESGLDNKIAAGGREIYNSQAATQINAHSPYDDIAKSNTKLDSEIIPQPLDALPTPAQNLIKKLLYQIRSLEKSPSFREHDKIIAEIKKSNDTQMLATLLKIFDERHPSAKDHYLLSGLRESIQNTLNKLSNPHIAKVLQAFTEKHPNPRDQAQAVKELYHRYGTPELKELFDKVLSAAGDVKFSIRQTYANLNGKYSADKHLITLNRRWALDIEPQRLAQTLLHELIHATIARAQYHRFSPQAYPELAHKLTPAQKAAVQEIDDLYILAFKTHQAQKRAKTLGDDEQEFYGFTNSKEFVAELANPKFRSYLEKQNIFKRVLEAIVKFFTGGGGEQTSILKALQESYEKYLDNFGERSESFFGKKEGGASPSESRTLFDKADSSESFSYTTGKAKGIAELRKDLKQALEPSLNKEIVNKEQGLSGVITTEEVKKIMSKKAMDKSIVNGFTRDEHIEVAKHIEKLFTESKLLRSHKDYKENPNILQVHRFIKDIEVNGKEANALITLFEKIQGKNKIYTIELESLESTPLNT